MSDTFFRKQLHHQVLQVRTLQISAPELPVPHFIAQIKQCESSASVSLALKQELGYLFSCFTRTLWNSCCLCFVLV